MSNTLYTIGFTHKSAEAFFTLLKQAGVRKVIDIRLRPSSQLAGFSKGRDLEYFLRVILGAGYEHRDEFVTTPELLNEAREKRVDFKTAMRKYLRLIRSRKIALDKKDFEDACLLCAELDPNHCHRKTLSQYLAKKCGLEVVHL